MIFTIEVNRHWTYST